MRHFGFALSCMMVFCVSVFAAEAELVANPSYQNWAKYKVGTNVTYTQEMQMAGAMAMTMSSEMKQTLAEITPEQAVCETAMTSSMMPGREQKNRIVIPAKIEKEKAAAQGTAPEGMEKVEVKQLDNETIKVNDKDYNCVVTQFSGEQKGMKASGKSWSNPDVPGGMVKVEMKAAPPAANANDVASAMTIKMNLKSFEIKQ